MSGTSAARVGLEEPLRSSPRRRRVPRGFRAVAAVLALAGFALVAPSALPAGASAQAASPPPAPTRDTSARAPAAKPPAWTAPVAEPSRPASEPRIYLTSHAPYGQPGASDRVTGACGDSSTLDTLYMCFDPGRDAEHFNGLSATVYFWPAGRESLGGHWKFGEGLKFRGLRVDFSPDSVPGTKAAWEGGVAGCAYKSTRSAGRLTMIAAGPAGQGLPVRSGVLYGVARLLVPRAVPGTGDCERPICIEWAEASLAFKVGELVQVTRGQRFVTWNSPDGKVCSPMREFSAPQPWQPRGKP